MRPCILVPSKLAGNYTEDEIRGMFLHELAHVKRQDVLWGWVGWQWQHCTGATRSCG
ncbi:M56 family metallopeptidase [Verrucomicrobium spinosum]|uniref:M56 family metallopeptidase n=1 Tax=Verrucomicrobium spinosum TaxID=2736 RepID=UPI00210A37F9|nr:M56 family metallopeptidase [Verrucomicrobium spinosum]